MLRGVGEVDLKALRQRYGLTQAQVAARAGVKQPEVSAVENRTRATPEARARILEAIQQLARPEVGLTPDVRAQALQVFATYGAKDVRLFGSVARGSTRPGSDIDFVAKFPPTFSLFQLVDLESELEDVIGLPVDVVSDDPRTGRVLEEIRRTAVPLGA
jgi:predicted nucleotidyltransferase